MKSRRVSLVLAAALWSMVCTDAARAQVPELSLPDLTTAAGVERAAAAARSMLSAAVLRAKAGEVVFARGNQATPFLPIERRALRAYVAIQVQAGRLAPAEAVAYEQRLLSEHPSVLAEAEASLASLPAGPGSQSQMSPAEICELLKVNPGDTTQMISGDCALMVGQPTRPEQLFSLGRPRDGQDACTTLRAEFAKARGGLREVDGLGEFGFAGVADGVTRYGVAFCRNGVAFIGVADAASPAVSDAMMTRARAVDARLRSLGSQMRGTGAASSCDPPAVGALADGAAAALTLQSGECLSGVLIDMGGTDYTMMIGGTQRRIALGDVALIDFTAAGSTLSATQPGEHALILRSGQQVAGRMVDLTGRTPLTITFDARDGRRSFSSSDIDRIILLPRAGATAPATATVPTGSSSAGSVLGTWRGCDGRMVRFTESGGEVLGHYTHIGRLDPALFTVGELSHRLKPVGPGRYDGAVQHKYYDGRRPMMPTTVTVDGDAYRDTGSDSCGTTMTRVKADGAPVVGTASGPAGSSPSCASFQGDWRRNDGMVIRVGPQDSGYRGVIVDPGALTVFAAGEQTLILDNSAARPGECTVQVKFKYADGRSEWRRSVVTMTGPDAFDTDNAGSWTRTAAAGAAAAGPPPGMPPAGMSPAGAGQTASQSPAQPFANFAGDWNTVNNGIRTVMRLQQQGNRVTGSYDYQEGLLLGVVVGNTLYVTWTHAPANTYMGTGQFVLSPDGRSFSGSWVSPAWNQQGTWTGTRR